MVKSSISHAIKNREEPRDVFITPKALAKLHINMINSRPTDKWLDPCANSGNYYKQFPTKNKDKCEIIHGQDFFDYDKKVDIIVQNPPYSILDKWFKKNLELKPRIFSFLIGVGNLTARRIEWCEKQGYGLTQLKMLKVYGWYGMSYMVTFEKNKPSIMSIDRTVWREEKQKKKKRIKLISK